MRPHIAALFVLTVAACNGGSTNPASTGNVDTFVGFMLESDHFICAGRFMCCTPAQAMQRYPNKPDEASCEAALDADTNREVTDPMALKPVLDAIAAGQATYDKNAAQQCVALMQSSLGACKASTDARVAPCANVLVGNIAVGGACQGAPFDFCQPSLYCKTGSQSSSGTCAARPTAGMPCDSSTPCANAWCDGTMCQPYVAQGGACAGPSSCTPGLACNGGTCGTPDGSFCD